MIAGIVEIAENNRHLSSFRGFLKVSENRQEIGRVPLDDITSLILTGHGITLSKNLLESMAERKAIIVSCGKNWHPVSMILPCVSHYAQAETFKNQIAATKPLNKQLWKKFVSCKIWNQAAVLSGVDPDCSASRKLQRMGREVKSGDRDNLESQAARYYWPSLVNKNFRRKRYSDDLNKYLNYGYTVLRAATARAVVSVGLHPALGIFHENRLNAFALVDDVMEPYRPLVDVIAREIWVEEPEYSILSPENKKRLAAVLTTDLKSDKGETPVINFLKLTAGSLAESYRSKQEKLVLPELPVSGWLF